MTWATDTIVATWPDPVTGTVYEFPHDNWGAQDLAVSFIDDDDQEIPLVLGADYSVSPTGRSTTGHLVTLIASVPTDVASLQVRRHTRTRQQAPAPVGAEGVTDSVDRAIAIAAELRFDLGITALLAEENRALLASLVITGGDVDASVLDIWNRVNVLEALWPEDTIMLLNAVQTATNKTLTAPVLTAPVLNTTATGSAILTDAGLAAASSDTLASSQAIVDYIAGQVFGLGYGTIDEHDFASDGATFAVLDIREADFEFELEGVTATTLTVSFSTNNGATWGAAITLASGITEHSGIGRVRAMTDAARKTLVELTHGPAADVATSLVRLQPTAQAENAIRFGGIEAGKIWMRRLSGQVSLNDPLWENVVLLVQGGFVENQGLVLNPPFVDLSLSGQTVAASGGAKGTTAVGVITGSSINIRSDGVEDYFGATWSTDFDPGAGPFSWDIAVKLVSLTQPATLFAAWGPSSTDRAWYIQVATNGDVELVYKTTSGGAENKIAWAAGITTDIEYRISVVINDLGVASCWVNGVQVGSPVALVAAIFTYPDNSLLIGRNFEFSACLDGNINRIRMTRAERTEFGELGLYLAR